jgi:hypothetical protein
MGRRLGPSRLWGAAVLLEDVGLLIPRAQGGGRLSEGTTDWQRARGGDQHEQDQTWPPALAATVCVAPVGERGERLGSLGACVVGIVKDPTAPAAAIRVSAEASTRDQEGVPGPLAVPQHPGQGGERLRAQAGACKACPAHGMGQADGGEPKSPPWALPS